ncbi:MAG: hypothetical protein OEW99_09625 [Gammaproteobacteria bacterium]|nr:hypothetical protein [Gammaproteobacteria bacterium]MDH5659572.1 hypothetical protein [Gammaproteobacteria bacterium]
MANEQKESLYLRGTNSVPQNLKINYPESQYPIIISSEPLWKRVPTRDLTGKPYADFMMLIPGLRKFESSRMREIINKIETVLKRYEEDIILADLNLKINVLWVTLQPHRGLSTEIAALIHHEVPEAKLVSQHSVSE